MSVCTRFAPSPTGYLHIGGVRTALFSWLYAKKHQGEFILRIEDTDRERSTQASVDAILEGMAWLELDYQQGPYYQTERFDHYKALVQQLLDEGKAYRCYCSKERLDKLREEQMANKQKPKYDGHCRELTQAPSADAPFCIRFKNPLDGVVSFKDVVYGEINIANTELDDLIIARTDGTPTYNFTVVIDDMDMGVTQVIRGDDHINNTPRQINLFKAFNKPIPTFAHVPMILGPDQKRLSKRHGAVSVLQYREDGILPQALLNYLVRLGWSHGDQEIFTREEMIAAFSLEGVNRAASSINPEKLLWLNQHYLKTLSHAEIAVELNWHYQRLGLADLSHGPSIEAVIDLLRERAKTVCEMAEQSLWLYQDVTEYAEKAVNKHFKPETVEILSTVAESIKSCEWQVESIKQAFNDSCEKLGLKLGKVAPATRIALTGDTVSPSIDATIYTLGREQTLTRIHKAMEYCQQL